VSMTEDDILRTAIAMTEAREQDRCFKMSDPTATISDLTSVRPQIRAYLQAAASAADLEVEIDKVGDYARVRFV
jgi:hypothetical protein